MKKNLIRIAFITLLIFSFVGCKSALVNYALKKKGIYDESIKLNVLKNSNKTIVLFPNHHVGTSNFYNDIRNKVDSLDALGFYFYKEMVEIKDTTKVETFYKYIKFQGFAQKKGGYESSIDSLLEAKNIKLKKEITNQPKYSEMNFTDKNSRIVDMYLEEVIEYYEANAGEIPINECDRKYSIYDFYDKCEKYEPNKKWRKKAMVDIRNHYLMKTLLEDKIHSKIGIIYGSAHTDFVRDSLTRIGFQLVQ